MIKLAAYFVRLEVFSVCLDDGHFVVGDAEREGNEGRHVDDTDAIPEPKKERFNSLLFHQELPRPSRAFFHSSLKFDVLTGLLARRPRQLLGEPFSTVSVKKNKVRSALRESSFAAEAGARCSPASN